MIVRSVQDIIGTDRDIRGDSWASRRLLVAKDSVPFSLNETTVEAGTELQLWYKHHIESNYVVEGEGSVKNLDSGESFPLKPGTCYTLDQHDRHIVKATTRLKFVCVFHPPLTGQEKHDEDGSYLPATEHEGESS
ncbi:ectoine synthase [Seminavis robusta]|uniref:L-ectoine synthase n=1 Tax=Seminavis robusta TaxID=568900 RepID=A0A9N8H0I2_9STRA|nr:ectoine synthase [Seminavis robusta]|eukprot:Sro21_g014600.1 ectoine synthase (135) ;mRNA; f:54039-54443